MFTYLINIDFTKLFFCSNRSYVFSKKLEFEIMCAVPFFIILYMKLTFGEFLSVLYENATGRCFMTICLIVYIAAYSFGRKIIHIEV